MLKPKPFLGAHYPITGEDVVAVPYTKAGVVYYYIVAYGCSRGVRKIAASLIDKTDQKVYGGNPLKQGTHWIIGFPQVPQVAGQYQLTIWQADGTAADLEITFKITVPAPARPDGGKRAFPTACPLPNETVPASFTAYGSNAPDGTAPTSATMQQSGIVGPNGSGAPVQTNEPGVWMFDFVNVPDGDGYTFVASNPANVTQNGNITVDSTLPPPAQAPAP